MRRAWLVVIGTALVWSRFAVADDAKMTVRSLVETEDPLADRVAHGWLKEVRNDPTRFMPLLLEYIDLKAIASASDFEAARLAANAAAVIVNACGDEGRAALAKRIQELQAERDRLKEQMASDSPEVAADKGRLRKMEYRLRHLEEALIDTFTRAKDSRLRDAVLDRLEKRDLDAHPVYLEYLEATCRGDPIVKERLKPLLEEPMLRDNPRLKSLLKAGPTKK